MKRQILDVWVDAVNLEEASSRILSWAREARGRYVCAANVHTVMVAHDDPAFREVVNGADLVVPDGMPLVWMLRWQGRQGQSRVYGPDLMLQLCAMAAEQSIPVGFYGGTVEALRRLVERLQQRFPPLRVVYAYSPPFRALTPTEEEAIREEIGRSGARLLFVGLGCPKQERWMARQRPYLPVVMVGVGAAFDFLAGLKPQAPRWMQRLGLEWLFRLASEPRRLARRYLYHNPRFVVLALRQLWHFRKERPGE